MQVFIMAAGQGTRLGMNTPKCLIRINGISLLERNLKLATNFNVSLIRVIVGNEGVWTPYYQEIVYSLVERYNGDVLINNRSLYTHSPTSLNLALNNAKDEDTLIIDGDIVYKPNLFAALTKSKSNTIVVNKSSSGGGSNVLMEQSGNMLLLRNIKKGLDSDYVYSGILWLKKNDVRVLSEELSSGLYDNDLFEACLRFLCNKRKVTCLVTEIDNIINLNTKLDLQQANNLFS